MASPAAGTPAWKRLGLKLRNEGQSGVAVPDVDAKDNTSAPAEARSEKQGGGKDVEPFTVPTESGKPSSLGKRKHQLDAAEHDVQALKTAKKSRSGEPEEASNHAGGVAVAAPTETSSEPKPQPKGDPNYRKKKQKKQKTERRTSDYSQEKPARSAAPVHSPAEPLQADSRPTLLPSTESDNQTPPPVATPKATKKVLRNASYDSWPSTDRRKSVTFTPDTKTVDGNSASNLFKKWVAEQKSAQGEFSSAEVSQFAPPPKVHPANGIPTSQPGEPDQAAKESKKPKKKKEKRPSAAPVDDTPKSAPSPNSPAPPKAEGKKKDFSLYIDYLTQYHDDYSNWKFNKAKQNGVLENALNVFRIPNTHLEALTSYIKGLKGAAVIERLKTKCQETLKELDEEDRKDPNAMNDIEARKQAKEEALEERVAKEKKRRQTDADIEELKDHPNPEGFVRRLKRRRAEALLTALNLAAPLPPPAKAQPNGVAPSGAAAVQPPKPNPRKRKSRTDVSSSSESSSSEESSSEESSSEESSSDESSDSESDSDSGSDESSESDSDDTSSEKGESSAAETSNSSEQSESSDGDDEGTDDSDSDSD